MERSNATAAEDAILGFLQSKEEISNSGDFASSLGIDHDVIVNAIKSLHGFEFVVAQVSLHLYFHSNPFRVFSSSIITRTPINPTSKMIDMEPKPKPNPQLNQFFLQWSWTRFCGCRTSRRRGGYLQMKGSRTPSQARPRCSSSWLCPQKESLTNSCRFARNPLNLLCLKC